MRKFTIDNNVSVEFDTLSFSIKALGFEIKSFGVTVRVISIHLPYPLSLNLPLLPLIYCSPNVQSIDYPKASSSIS